MKDLKTFQRLYYFPNLIQKVATADLDEDHADDGDECQGSHGQTELEDLQEIVIYMLERKSWNVGMFFM